jgi:hypothetical protein
MAEFEAGGMTIEKWMQSIGRESGATSARWIQKGMIAPVNILGKNFITREEDERFWARAKAGEFAQLGEGIIKKQKEGGK